MLLLSWGLITFLIVNALQPKTRAKILLFSILMPLLGLIVFSLLTLSFTMSAFYAGQIFGNSLFYVPFSMLIIYIFLANKLQKEKNGAKEAENNDGNNEEKDN